MKIQKGGTAPLPTPMGRGFVEKTSYEGGVDKKRQNTVIWGKESKIAQKTVI